MRSHALPLLVVSLVTTRIFGIWIGTVHTPTMQKLGSADAEMAKAYVEHLLMVREGKGKALAFAKAFPLPNWAQTITCEAGECKLRGVVEPSAQQRIDRFEQVARNQTIITDKVNKHSYQTMYGMKLVPLMEGITAPKLFEIGLGCNMNYGPGASVDLWKALFPGASLWEAEFDEKCVKVSQVNGLLEGIHAVTGDQGDEATVQSWIAKSGGEFDVVIDDGGHRNKQIRTSFETLWPHVKPGGMYFLEDLQVGRYGVFNDGGVVIADMVESWVEQLLTQKIRDDFPLPAGAHSILCQAEACVIEKARP